MSNEDNAERQQILSALTEQFAPIERAARYLKRTPEYIEWTVSERASHEASKKYMGDDNGKDGPKFGTPEYETLKTAAAEARKKSEAAMAKLFERTIKEFPGSKLMVSAVVGALMGDVFLDRQFEKMGISGIQAGMR